jgi:hypothetical protein
VPVVNLTVVVLLLLYLYKQEPSSPGLATLSICGFYLQLVLAIQSFGAPAAPHQHEYAVLSLLSRFEPWAFECVSPTWDFAFQFWVLSGFPLALLVAGAGVSVGFYCCFQRQIANKGKGGYNISAAFNPAAFNPSSGERMSGNSPAPAALKSVNDFDSRLFLANNRDENDPANDPANDDREGSVRGSFAMGGGEPREGGGAATPSRSVTIGGAEFAPAAGSLLESSGLPHGLFMCCYLLYLLYFPICYRTLEVSLAFFAKPESKKIFF